MSTRRSPHRRTATILLATSLALAFVTGQSRTAAQQQQEQGTKEQPFSLITNVNIVSVDVVVRDSSGNIVRGLKKEDFTVLEDGKPQKIENFSFQEIATDAPPANAESNVLAGLEDKLRAEVKRAVTATENVSAAETAPITETNLVGHRLLILLFDVSSMKPEDIQRAVEEGQKYVNETMANSDMVAVVTIGTRLNVLTDFTSSREDLIAALQTLAYSDGTAVDLAAVATASTDDAAATTDSDTATTEDASLEEFNNDVRLRALKTLAETVAPIQQKKAVLYFSSGMSRNGDDNQIELRAASNAANRANMSIYPVDSRGLQAVVAGGDASRASGRGSGLFTGQGASQAFSRLNASQETLTTLASDTGGRAFTDSNDFGDAFKRVQRDLSAYYLLGYASTNATRDGKFRRITVRLAPKLNAKVEARPGYYAGRSIEYTNRRDREAQLNDQMAAAVSSTDVPMVVGTGWFRQAADKFYIPIALVIPGSSVPVGEGAKMVTLDVRGVVRDEQGRTISNIKDTLEVPSGGAETLAGKQVLYQSGVTLPPGRFSVKVVVRENTGGGIGSFEAPIYVPQLRDNAMKVSSVVMSTQVQKATAKSDNPLVRDGVQLLPNLTRVVTKNQNVYFYYEVYDPALVEQAPHLRTSMAFYRGDVKVFETPMVERQMIDDAARKAVVFQFEVPASSFKAGTYTCQINIIDTVATKASFPRVSFVVRDY